MTFVASASAILHNRCQPVFVDVDPDTMLMDKVALLELIRRHEIDAVMAVHLYGQMLDLEEISYEARQQGIALIEDAAQVLGSSRSGRPAGVYCDITCLSFDPTKVVGAYGSGGALLTNDDGLAEKARLLRYHGHTGNSVYKHPGFNSQMDTLQATIINVKLNYLDQWQARRCKIAAYFAEGLTQTPYVQLLKTLPGNVHNCHKFVICVQGRDRIQRHLATRGIQTKIHYPLPLHLQPCFGNGAKSPSLPHAEQSAKAVLSLPMYPELADEEADYIVACILEAYEDR
jgi:dTDP-4-amino-4,6-dideoxygalactose transaminase